MRCAQVHACWRGAYFALLVKLARWQPLHMPIGWHMRVMLHVVVRRHMRVSQGLLAAHTLDARLRGDASQARTLHCYMIWRIRGVQVHTCWRGAYVVIQPRHLSLAQQQNGGMGFCGASLLICLEISHEDVWLIPYPYAISPINREAPSDAAGRPILEGANFASFGYGPETGLNTV